MNLRIIYLIWKKEFLTRVKKKSFLLITFLAPVLFILVTTLPAILMKTTKDKEKKIAVVDKSHQISQFLQNNDLVQFSDYTDSQQDSLEVKYKKLGLDGYLYISDFDSDGISLSVTSYSEKPLSTDLLSNIEKQINTRLQVYRTEHFNISGLQDIISDIQKKVEIKTYKIDENGQEKRSESSIFSILSYVMGMIIYLFISMFSSIVMTSVIEEKSSRVVEVLMSSVKPLELMMGKVLGIASVALSQFILWIVLTVVLAGLAFSFLSSPQLSDTAQSVNTAMMIDNSADAMLSSLTHNLGEDNPVIVVLSTVADMPIITMIVSFFIYFILGYLMYSALFAAVGASVENQTEAGSLTFPITLPLLVGFFLAMIAGKSPDGIVAFWGSMIPFTSPMVMLARLPYGVPLWELLLSISILFVTFVFIVWISAKIFQVAILINGKKTTFKDWWKWINQK